MIGGDIQLTYYDNEKELAQLSNEEGLPYSHFDLVNCKMAYMLKW